MDVLPYLVLPYLTLPYLTLPYFTLPYLILPYLTLGCSGRRFLVFSSSSNNNSRVLVPVINVLQRYIKLPGWTSIFQACVYAFCL